MKIFSGVDLGGRCHLGQGCSGKGVAGGAGKDVTTSLRLDAAGLACTFPSSN